jgi:hypothetical protein
MYDEYGEFFGCVFIKQREWQIHYFDALDMKPAPDNDEFHDALEQFADNPDSVTTLSSTVLIVLITFVTMRQ